MSLISASERNIEPRLEEHFADALERITFLSLQINNASNLLDMLSVAVQQSRELLNGDRALIYQFLLDGDGVVMAESVGEGWRAILGELIGDPCFPRKCSQLYQEGRLSIIEDTHIQPMEPCYADLLARMQVRANLVMPILVGSQAHLFGLLIMQQCDRPRQWQPIEISLLRNITTQLGIALHNLTEGKQAKECSIKDDSERRQFALESCGDGVWDWNVQTNEVFFSHRWKAMIGFEDDEISNNFSEWDIRIHPDDREKAYTEVDKHFRGETQQYEIEHRLQCKDGSYKWILARGRIFSLAADGSPLRFVGTHVDISDRKSSELALHQSETRQRAILTAMPDLLLRVSRDGLCLDFMSSAIAEENQFEPIRQHLSEVLPPKLLQRQLQAIELAIATNQLQIYEHQLLKLGNLAYEEVRVAAINENEALIIVRDITNRVISENCLEQISRHVPGVIYQYHLRTDGSSHFPYASQGIRDIYNVSPEDVCEDASIVFARLYPEDVELVVKTIAESSQNLTVWQCEYRVQFDEQRIIWVQGRATPQRQVDGSTLWHGYINEITDRKLAELDLAKAKLDAEAATKAKSEFLANMSHEIRTPMNGVLGIAELLAATGLTAEQQNLIQIIQHSGNTLLAIVNDILDFSKIEAGMMTLEAKEFVLDDILSSVCRILEKQALDKQIQLDYAIAPHLPRKFIGDRTRLYQILLNLIGNAVKFTQIGQVAIAVRGRSPVNTQTEPYQLIFEVRDTGIGIQRKYLAELFQAFTQVDASTSRKYGGTGLGLAITKRLVELMGGTIWVESFGHVGGSPPLNWLPVSASQGSTFYFAISLFANSATLQPQKTEIAITIDAEMAVKFPLRVLLVEDNIFNQKIASLILEKLGYQADIAHNGLEAIGMVEQENYDLVLMDVHMPEMDGLTATQIIRRSCKYRPWIVAMTANVLPEDRQACFEAGMNDYLSKPFKVKDIVQVLSAYMRNNMEGDPTLADL